MVENKSVLVGAAVAAVIVIVLLVYFLAPAEPSPEEVAVEERDIVGLWSGASSVKDFSPTQISGLDRTELEALEGDLAEKRASLVEDGAPQYLIDLTGLYVSNTQMLRKYSEFDSMVSPILEEVSPDNVCNMTGSLSSALLVEESLLNKVKELNSGVAGFKQSYPNKSALTDSLILFDAVELKEELVFSSSALKSITNACAVTA